MAKDTKLSGGMIPGTNLPRHEPSEFDKFQAANLDKAIITVPTADGTGEKPLTATNAPAIPNVLEVPAGMTPQQAAQLRAAHDAIMRGQAPPAANPNAPPPLNVVVPDNQSRVWNPLQPFIATARLSDMEASVNAGAVNPSAVLPNAPVSVKLNPKVDCPVVLIDCYRLLSELQSGRWILQGGPPVQTMLVRLRAEIENV